MGLEECGTVMQVLIDCGQSRMMESLLQRMKRLSQEEGDLPPRTMHLMEGIVRSLAKKQLKDYLNKLSKIILDVMERMPSPTRERAERDKQKSISDFKMLIHEVLSHN